MEAREIYALGSYIRSYMARYSIEGRITGEEAYTILNRSERWSDIFKDKWMFYKFLNQLSEAGDLSLLRCCSREVSSCSRSQKRWSFYGPTVSNLDNFNFRNEEMDKEGRNDLYAYERNKRSKDGSLFRSYQEVFIYERIKEIHGIGMKRN